MNARPTNRQASTTSARALASHRGFTLVEVLVTTAVTIVALTGLATLQILSLRAAESSLQRSQANDLAYELVDRLRIYRSEALAGAYDAITLCDDSERNGADARACQFDDADSFADDKAIEVDLEGWWHAVVEADLPNWYAGIERTGDTFRVSVQWDDARAEPDPANPSAQIDSCLAADMPVTMQEICVTTQL